MIASNWESLMSSTKSEKFLCFYHLYLYLMFAVIIISIIRLIDEFYPNIIIDSSKKLKIKIISKIKQA